MHVGLSFTLVRAVLTLQLRLTVPLNPFVPTTLIVPVFPLVAPALIVREVLPPPPAVNPGCAVIVRLMFVVAVSAPEVPVMVTLSGAEVTAAEVLAARVSTWVPAAEPEENDAVRLLGTHLQFRIMDRQKSKVSPLERLDRKAIHSEPIACPSAFAGRAPEDSLSRRVANE